MCGRPGAVIRGAAPFVAVGRARGGVLDSDGVGNNTRVSDREHRPRWHCLRHSCIYGYTVYRGDVTSLDTASWIRGAIVEQVAPETQRQEAP